jgi:hypothetical protein
VVFVRSSDLGIIDISDEIWKNSLVNQNNHTQGSGKSFKS